MASQVQACQLMGRSQPPSGAGSGSEFSWFWCKLCRRNFPRLDVLTAHKQFMHPQLFEGPIATQRIVERAVPIFNEDVESTDSSDQKSDTEKTKVNDDTSDTEKVKISVKVTSPKIGHTNRDKEEPKALTKRPKLRRRTKVKRYHSRKWGSFKNDLVTSMDGDEAGALNLDNSLQEMFKVEEILSKYVIPQVYQGTKIYLCRLCTKPFPQFVTASNHVRAHSKKLKFNNLAPKSSQKVLNLDSPKLTPDNLNNIKIKNLNSLPISLPKVTVVIERLNLAGDFNSRDLGSSILSSTMGPTTVATISTSLLPPPPSLILKEALTTQTQALKTETGGVTSRRKLKCPRKWNPLRDEISSRKFSWKVGDELNCQYSDSDSDLMGLDQSKFQFSHVVQKEEEPVKKPEPVQWYLIPKAEKEEKNNENLAAASVEKVAEQSEEENVAQENFTENGATKTFENEKVSEEAAPEKLSCAFSPPVKINGGLCSKYNGNYFTRKRDKKLKYICKFCHKEFQSIYRINWHLPVHTGERNYKCSKNCQKTFANIGNQLHHEKTCFAPSLTSIKIKAKKVTQEFKKVTQPPVHSNKKVKVNKKRKVNDLDEVWTIEKEEAEKIVDKCLAPSLFDFYGTDTEEDRSRQAVTRSRYIGIMDRNWFSDGRLEGEREIKRHCLCHQFAYGRMVACDSRKCSIGWFHFSCVGISKKPRRGFPWYCPLCTSLKT